MDLSKIKQNLPKLKAGLITAVLITSFSIPGYACKTDMNTHSPRQATYTSNAKGQDYFLMVRKMFFERWANYNGGKQNKPRRTPYTKPTSKVTSTQKPAATPTLKTTPTLTSTIKPTPTLAPTIKPTPTLVTTIKPTHTLVPTIRPTPTLVPSATSITVTDGMSIEEKALLDLVNQARVAANLKPLEYDLAVASVAMLKAKDIVDNNYFSHTSPTYGSPFDMMKKFGIKYAYAGENIAAGYSTVQDVFDGWMNSPGHKANILNQNFTYCGFGIVNGGPYGGKSWVQMFISKP